MSIERVNVTPAREGIRVPVEGFTGVYFAAGEVRSMRRTPFLDLLIREGDLKIAPATVSAPAVAPSIIAEH